MRNRGIAAVVLVILIVDPFLSSQGLQKKRYAAGGRPHQQRQTGTGECHP